MFENFDMEQMVISVSAAAVVALGAKYLPRVVAGVPFIQPKDAHQRLLENSGDYLVLDVREPGEFNDALGHIKGAINIPLGQLSERLAKNKEDLASYMETPIIVVCRSANRAASAARVLKKAGFQKALVLNGGMLRWKRDGLPSS